MNKDLMNKVFNIVVSYEETTQYEEIVKILEKFNYDITADNSHALSITLNTLLDNDYPIQKILQRYSFEDFSQLDETVNKILDDIYGDKYDSIINALQDKFSESQRKYLFGKISEKLSIENYQYNRLPFLFKIIISCDKNVSKIQDFLNNFLDKNLITNEKILTEFCDILEIVKTSISLDFINLFISNLIEKNISTNSLNTMKIVCKYKSNISIENIKKIKSYVEILNDKNLYQYIFELYESNYQTMIDNEETKEQLENFLVNYIDLSNDINNTINLISNIFEKITNVGILFEKYIKIDFDTEDVKNNFERLLIKLLNAEVREKQKNIINIILNRNLFEQNEIKKIVSLFKNQELIEFSNIIDTIKTEFFNQNNDNYKLNNLNILIERQDKDNLIKYLELVFEDLSNENLIIKILDILKNNKIKYMGKYNSKLWEIFNDASNSTSSLKVKECFILCIAELKLKESRHKEKTDYKESIVK